MQHSTRFNLSGLGSEIWGMIAGVRGLGSGPRMRMAAAEIAEGGCGGLSPRMWRASAEGGCGGLRCERGGGGGWWWWHLVHGATIYSSECRNFVTRARSARALLALFWCSTEENWLHAPCASEVNCCPCPRCMGSYYRLCFQEPHLLIFILSSR